jgi:hypothetical protein
MKKTLLAIALIILISLAGTWIYSIYQFRDRHGGYSIDLNLGSSQTQILAGFSKVDISPEILDTWVDVNGDARYNPEDGDTYTDGNGNGKFDAVWLAGFHKARAAQSILDPLWARAMVLDAGNVKMALVVIDMIGYGNEDVIATRKLILESNPDLDYVIISSTHVHSSPDLLGIWGESDYKSGVDPSYLTQVQNGIQAAVSQAVSQAKPAYFKFTEEMELLKPLVALALT